MVQKDATLADQSIFPSTNRVFWGPFFDLQPNVVVLLFLYLSFCPRVLDRVVLDIFSEVLFNPLEFPIYHVFSYSRVVLVVFFVLFFSATLFAKVFLVLFKSQLGVAPFFASFLLILLASLRSTLVKM